METIEEQEIPKELYQEDPYILMQYFLRRDVLERYMAVIDRELGRKNKRSNGTSMATKQTKQISYETNNRRLHQNSTGKIAEDIAGRLGLHTNLARMMGENHDKGHTWLAHEGEFIGSAVMEDLGVGYLVHNAQTMRQFLYHERIEEVILHTIQRENPNISKRELEKIQDSLFLLQDAFLCHNGESAIFEFSPQMYKTKEDSIQEMMNCYIYKGYDRKLTPATIEGCLMRISDIISYVGQDLEDGFNEGIIDDLDEHYMELLTQFGMTEEQIQKAMQQGDYDYIVREIETEIINDVVDNSSNVVIKMSEEMSKKVFALRDYNYQKVVSKTVTGKEHDILVGTSKQVILDHCKILLEEGILGDVLDPNGQVTITKETEEKYKDTIHRRFIQYLKKVDTQNLQNMVQITEMATKQSLQEETDIALECIKNGEKRVYRKNKDIPLISKSARINQTIQFIKEQCPEQGSEEEFQAEEYQEMLLRKIKSNKPMTNYLPMNQRVGCRLAEDYLASLVDREYVYLIHKMGLTTEEDHKMLKKKYGDLTQEEKDDFFISGSLQETMQVQQEEKRRKEEER